MRTVSGPTKGAETRADPADEWASRRWLGLGLRVAIFALPLAAGVACSWVLGQILPPERVGIGRWPWLAAVLVAATIVATTLQRFLGRWLPLASLMQLSLVFPDQAPSRARTALRSSNGKKLLRELQEAGPDATIDSEMLARLLLAINRHDRLTRGHSERVRAYSELIGEELGLSADDMHKLRWAALLHDAGKLTVPEHILNKDGRPTDEEWHILSRHPGAGGAILEPLRPWLGEWVHAADQHHCRWDGDGYPSDLAGLDITLAGRIVAVADAYDVMTSARSYKRPMPHAVARQELTACAGTQFDPAIVRAFLNVSVGRLRSAAGMLSWIANGASSGQLPASVAWNTVTTGATAAATVVAVTVTGAADPGMLDPADTNVPELLALDTSFALELAPVAGSGLEDGLIELRLTATGGEGTVTIVAGPPDNGVVIPGVAEGAVAQGDAPATWVQPASYFPDADFAGDDEFLVEACDEGGQCAVTRASISVAPVNDPPRARPDRALVQTGSRIAVAVLENDDDPEGDALAIDSLSATAYGQAEIVGSTIEYESIDGFVGVEDFEYTVVDTNGAAATMGVTIEVFEDEPPVEPTPTPEPEPSPRPQPQPVAAPTPTPTPGPTPTPTPDPTPTPTPAPTSTPGPPPTPTPTPAPANQPPTALGDIGFGFTGTEDTTFTTAPVTANDIDIDHAVDPSSVVILTPPVKGTAVANADGTLTYVPAANTSGADTLTYTITDPAGAVSNTATVTITISPVNDPPLAVNDTGIDYLGTEDVLLTTGVVTDNDSDADHAIDPTSVVIVSGPSKGSASPAVDGTITYTPDPDTNGIDTFTYRITDGAGASSNAATVTVSIAAVDDPPVAVDDSLTVTQGFSATTVNLILNDSDPDGHPIMVTGVGSGSNGSTVDNGDGTVTYTHDGGPTSTDSFTYFIEDFSGMAGSGTVNVTVDPVEDYDAVPGGTDNCPFVFNPVQFDSDGDGLGDACDPMSTSPSTGTLTDSGAALGTEDSRFVVLGDIDGDGDLDAVFANHDDSSDAWRNDGTGVLTSTGGSIGSDDQVSAALGDVDGDGDLDIVFADTSAQPNTVYVNDGTGAFSDSGQSLGWNDSQDVVLGDFDGDGDLDAAFANLTTNEVYLNDGTGTFAAAQVTGGGATEGIATGDIDGDGDLDLVFANNGSPSRVWINDGTGTFTNSGQSLDSSKNFEVALGDLDGDGDLDAVFASDNDPSTIWRNDGTGDFTDTGQSIGLHARHVALGDIDGDGDLDAVFAAHSGDNELWINDGTGTLSDSGQAIASDNTEAVALGDVDGDGDLDVVFANNGSPNSVFTNS